MRVFMGVLVLAITLATGCSKMGSHYRQVLTSDTWCPKEATQCASLLRPHPAHKQDFTNWCLATAKSVSCNRRIRMTDARGDTVILGTITFAQENARVLTVQWDAGKVQTQNSVPFAGTLSDVLVPGR